MYFLSAARVNKSHLCWWSRGDILMEDVVWPKMVLNTDLPFLIRLHIRQINDLAIELFWNNKESFLENGSFASWTVTYCAAET